MILNSLKKELKKFTRFATSPIKNLKASDLANALKELSKKIDILYDDKGEPNEIIEEFRGNVKYVFTTTVLKKYYKPGNDKKTAWKRSGLVGLILRELYVYLTENFLNYPVPQSMPDWLKISNKTTLKDAFANIYKSESNNEWWIASVLCNEKVLENFIKVHDSIYKFNRSSNNDSDPSFLPTTVYNEFNKIFEELKKVGSDTDYKNIATGFLNWAEKLGEEYPNICKYSNIKNLKDKSRLEKLNKILDSKKIEKYKANVEKYSIHIERLCSNLRMFFEAETQRRVYLFKNFEYNENFLKIPVNALNDILKKLQEKSSVRNKNVVEVSDEDFFKVYGENEKIWKLTDSDLESHLWGKTGEPELEDLKQYGLGTCYLHAALMSLLQSDKGKKLIKKCFVSIDEKYVTMQLYKIAKTENYNKTNDSNVVRHGVTFIPEENPTLFKLKRTYDSDDNSNSNNAQWPHYFIKVFSEYKKLIPSAVNSNEYMYDPLKTSKGERFVEGGRSSWVFTAITGRKGRQNSSPRDYAAILKDYEEKGQTLSQRGANFISKPDPVEYLKEKLEKGGNKSRALTCNFIESTYRLSDTHVYTIVGIKDSGVCLLEPNKTRPLPLKFSELNEKGIKLFKDELDTKDDITAQNWKAKVEEFKNKYKDQKIEQPYFIFNKKHFKDGKDEFIIPFEEFRSNCNIIGKVNLSKKKGAQGKKTTPKPPKPPKPPTTPPKPPTTPKPLTTPKPPKPPKPPTTRPPMR